MVRNYGLRFTGSGIRVQGLGLRAQGPRASGLGCTVKGRWGRGRGGAPITADGGTKRAEL